MTVKEKNELRIEKKVNSVFDQRKEAARSFMAVNRVPKQSHLSTIIGRVTSSCSGKNNLAHKHS
jgi:hypothetical protein